MKTETENIMEVGKINCDRRGVDIERLENLQLEMLKRPDLADTARVFSAIGNESRLKLLFLLSEAGELCVCDMSDIMGQSVSRVSHQLRKLKDSGFVNIRKAPPTVYYSISKNPFANILVNFMRMGGMTSELNV